MPSTNKLPRLATAIMLGAGLWACAGLSIAEEADRKLILVSIDGLRWQEVFRGADTVLAADETVTKWREQIGKQFVDVEDRRSALMPFLHSVIGKQGILIGNRDSGSCARVTNKWWFSYPGYNELLTGKPDDAITSNAATPNPNVTFLEWLNRQAGYKGRVHAFGSWDVFPAILNEARSGIPVNAGFEPLEPPLNDVVRTLNRLQQDTPSPWDTVRLDVWTHHYALETLREREPGVLYIAYGETDDFAHDGRYDQYLLAAHRIDGFLRELWDTTRADPRYAGRTTMIITVDHGRGGQADASWQHHASGEAVKGYISSLQQQYPDGITGSDQIWMAAIGSEIDPSATGRYDAGNCAGLNQVAASALKALDIDYKKFDPAIGKPLRIFTGGGADK